MVPLVLSYPLLYFPLPPSFLCFCMSILIFFSSFISDFPFPFLFHPCSTFITFISFPLFLSSSFYTSLLSIFFPLPSSCFFFFNLIPFPPSSHFIFSHICFPPAMGPSGIHFHNFFLFFLFYFQLNFFYLISCHLPCSLLTIKSPLTYLYHPFFFSNIITSFLSFFIHHPLHAFSCLHPLSHFLLFTFTSFCLF